MNLSSIDLNLLKVFDAIMAERNVTRAGERVGLSQPAMSNALSRLRHHLKDDLFVRTAEGMRPTPRAMDLSGPVRRSLEAIEDALTPADFDPGQARLRYRVATNDYFATILIPEVMARLHSSAPGIDLRLLPTAGRTLDLLDVQDADLGIAVFGEVPDRFEKTQFLEETYVVVMKAGHPLAEEGALTLGAYVQAGHVLATPRGDARGYIDGQLADLGLTRRVVLTMNQFSSVPAVVARTGLIATLPKRIADHYAGILDLVMRPCPVPQPPAMNFGEMLWHGRLGRHPAHAWVRDLIAQAAADL